MTANPILLQKKYSRVIECFAKQQGLSLDAALDFFYHSQVYLLMRDIKTFPEFLCRFLLSVT